jgi:hypothetical protein
VGLAGVSATAAEECTDGGCGVELVGGREDVTAAVIATLAHTHEARTEKRDDPRKLFKIPPPANSILTLAPR